MSDPGVELDELLDGNSELGPAYVEALNRCGAVSEDGVPVTNVSPAAKSLILTRGSARRLSGCSG
jgi:hypothetical protein